MKIQEKDFTQTVFKIKYWTAIQLASNLLKKISRKSSELTPSAANTKFQ